MWKEKENERVREGALRFGRGSNVQQRKVGHHRTGVSSARSSLL